MNSTTAYKVQVKLGQAEFIAEGPESTVKEHLAAFLQIASTHTIDLQNHAGHGNGHSNGNDRAELGPAPATSLVSEISARPAGQDQWVDSANGAGVFTQDADGLISVCVLPKTDSREADTLLLILLGFLRLKEQIKVKASDLLQAVRQSGIFHLSRIDTVLDRHPSLVKRGGIKRGSWYALTNPGITHA